MKANAVHNLRRVVFTSGESFKVPMKRRSFAHRCRTRTSIAPGIECVKWKWMMTYPTLCRCQSSTIGHANWCIEPLVHKHDSECCRSEAQLRDTYFPFQPHFKRTQIIVAASSHGRWGLIYRDNRINLCFIRSAGARSTGASPCILLLNTAFYPPIIIQAGPSCVDYCQSSRRM